MREYIQATTDKNCHLAGLKENIGKNKRQKGQRKNNWKWLFIATTAYLLGVSA